MKLVVLAPFFGMATACLWGVTDFLGAKAAKVFNPVLATFFIQLIGFLVYGVIYVLFLAKTINIDIGGFVLATAAGLFMTFGLTMFYKGLRIGPVSLVAPIAGAYPMITTTLVVLLFGAVVSGMQLVGITLIILGVMTAAGLLTLSRTERRITKGVAFGMCTFLLFGIAFAALGEAILLVGWELATLIQLFFSAAGFLPFLFFMKRADWLPAKQLLAMAKHKDIVGAGLAQLAGFILLNLSLAQVSNGAIISAIAATYPVVTMSLALVFFKETISKVAVGGVALSMFGVFLLSV